MSKAADLTSKVVARRLFLIELAFYIIYYILSVILIGGFHLDWEYLDDLPFQHVEHGFYSGDLGLAAWLALLISILLIIPLVFFIGRSTRIAWDYAATVFIWHFVITCIVTQKFPTNGAWWTTMLIGAAVVMAGSELCCYFFRDIREIDIGG